MSMGSYISSNETPCIFGYRGPKWPTKKIFGNFRDGGAKSVYMLTERRQGYFEDKIQIF